MFDVNYFLRRQFVQNVKLCLLKKIRKSNLIMTSAEFAHSVLNVNQVLPFSPAETVDIVSTVEQ